MNNIQQLYGAKYYFLVQERRQNVCLKKYKFDLKISVQNFMFTVENMVFVGNIHFFIHTEQKNLK